MIKFKSYLFMRESVIKLPHLGSMSIQHSSFSFSCLRNTEKGFTCQPSLGEDYQNLITSYLEKGYICKVRQAEKICSVSDTSLTSLYAVLTGPLLRRGSCLMLGQSYKIHVKTIKFYQAASVKKICLKFSCAFVILQ